MTRPTLNKYKTMLEAKRAGLWRGIRSREAIAVEKTPDAIDEVQFASEREVAIRNLDRESSLLLDIDDALNRVADGGYGICLHCEEAIEPKRLHAIPWAKCCVPCQEKWRASKAVSHSRRRGPHPAFTIPHFASPNSQICPALVLRDVTRLI